MWCSMLFFGLLCLIVPWSSGILVAIQLALTFFSSSLFSRWGQNAP